jgi:hypothetical protein
MRAVLISPDQGSGSWNEVLVCNRTILLQGLELVAPARISEAIGQVSDLI